MRLTKIIRKRTFFLVAILLILSLLPRLWELASYPPLVVDEPAYLRDINQLMEMGGFYPTGFQWDFSQATLVYYPTIFIIDLFKMSNQLLALRLISTVSSLLALIPFFFIIKKHSNNLIAFCTTLLFSYSYYYLQFSRVGWGVIHSVTLGLYFIWILQSALKNHSKLLFIIAGIFGALTLYTYRAGEVYIIAGLVLLFTKIIFWNTKIKEKIIVVLIFLFTFFIISAPWINQIITNWEKYILRENVVSIFEVSYPYHGLTNQASVFTYQIITTLKSWILLMPIDGNAGNIENSRYLPLYSPPITLLIIPLFWLGLIIALKNWRNTYIWFFIFLAGLLGQIMTVHPPNGARALIILPVIYLFIGLSLNYLYLKYKYLEYVKIIFILFSLLVAISDFLFYQFWMSWIEV